VTVLDGGALEELASGGALSEGECCVGGDVILVGMPEHLAGVEVEDDGVCRVAEPDAESGPVRCQRDEHLATPVVNRVEYPLDEVGSCEDTLDLVVTDHDLAERAVVLSESVEVGGGVGVAEVVGPAPRGGVDVGVDEVGVGAVVKEQPGPIDIACFGGVVESGLGAGAIVDIET
jgi:hypothetical protein